MNCKWRMILVAVALVLGSASKTQAGFIPVGVQTNVSLNTVTNTWGWTQIYRGSYASGVSAATAFSGAQQYLMLAGFNRGTGQIDVLAAALTTDVLQITGSNVTHAANGAFWYRNSLSMGFAPNSTISQNSADTTNAPGWGVNAADGAQRLSWHTGTGLGGLDINTGWRSGLNNNYSNLERIVFTTNAGVAVPEPSSIVLFGGAAAIAGCFSWCRRKRAARG